MPIITTVFRSSVAALAKAQRYPDLPLAVIQHPVAYISDEELEARARDAVQQVARGLLAPR